MAQIKVARSLVMKADNLSLIPETWQRESTPARCPDLCLCASTHMRTHIHKINRKKILKSYIYSFNFGHFILDFASYFPSVVQDESPCFVLLAMRGPQDLCFIKLLLSRYLCFYHIKHFSVF